MPNHREDFIELALRHQALQFGEFTLKSGRTSPYFFNAGNFCTGASLASIGRCYAGAITDARLEFDMLLGPAYKGIPLAVATAIGLYDTLGRDVPCAFNRKEAKTHGEGGKLMGAGLQGRVLIVDDVITAGTAVREVVSLVRESGAEVVGVLIGLDRGERGRGESSAVLELSVELGTPVYSVAHLDDIVRFLQMRSEYAAYLPRMLDYRQQWGALST